MSNNYPDQKWRVACEHTGTTFPSRDAAARAEYVAVGMVKRFLEEEKKTR